VAAGQLAAVYESDSDAAQSGYDGVVAWKIHDRKFIDILVDSNSGQSYNPCILRFPI
jgi:hypothetical protein